jgi:16S rRNA (guanine527-N7)-methyltransferase
MKLDTLLRRGLKAMGLALPPPTQARLVAFVRLLEKWNRQYNLTAVRDPEQMVTRHLLDSLSVLPDLRGPRVLDIGTGAGLPGIPLALARPDLSFTLLDSNAKKLTFVRQALHELGITNVTVAQARAEKFHPEAKFDTLIARALASLHEMLAVSAHLCAPGGRLLAMKGVFPQEELAAIGANYHVEVKALTVPGLDAERHLVILEPR